MLNANKRRLFWKGSPKGLIKRAGGLAGITKETKETLGFEVTNGVDECFSEFTPEQLFNGNISLKGRGNSSWARNKKPYSFTLLSPSGSKLKIDFLGIGVDCDYNLLAMSQDKTYMRTIFTTPFCYALGADWAAGAQHIEIYVLDTNTNIETFVGLFTVTNKVKAGDAGVPITSIGKNDLTGEALTGGYVVEQQPPEQLGADEIFLDANGNQPGLFVDARFGKTWGFKVPDGKDMKWVQNQYIKGEVDDMYHRVFNEPKDDLEAGYRKVLDAYRTAINYAINDISKQSDAGQSSWYITKPRGEKMFFGYFWDADGCWGVAGDYVGDGAYPVDLSKADDTYIRYKIPVYTELFKDPYFVELVASIFKEREADLHQLYADAKIYAAKLAASGAPERDRAKWGRGPGTDNILDDEFFIPLPNYQAELDRFFAFIATRFRYNAYTLYDYVEPKAVN